MDTNWAAPVPGMSTGNGEKSRNAGIYGRAQMILIRLQMLSKAMFGKLIYEWKEFVC